LLEYQRLVSVALHDSHRAFEGRTIGFFRCDQGGGEFAEAPIAGAPTAGSRVYCPVCKRFHVVVVTAQATEGEPCPARVEWEDEPGRGRVVFALRRTAVLKAPGPY
jgi:hypothetical protein